MLRHLGCRWTGGGGGGWMISCDHLECESNNNCGVQSYTVEDMRLKIISTPIGDGVIVSRNPTLRKSHLGIRQDSGLKCSWETKGKTKTPPKPKLPDTWTARHSVALFLASPPRYRSTRLMHPHQVHVGIARR